MRLGGERGEIGDGSADFGASEGGPVERGGTGDCRPADVGVDDTGQAGVGVG